MGLDTALYVAENLYPAVPHDERRDVLVPPDFMTEMVKRGWTGNKAGQGFYKKQRGEGGKPEYAVLDYNTMEYRPSQKVRFPSIDAAKAIEDTADRIRALVYGRDRVGEFLWKTISANLIYTANRIPESHYFVETNRAATGSQAVSRFRTMYPWPGRKAASG